MICPFLAAGTYTAVYNFLDVPVGVVPVTKENEDDQTKLEEYNHGDLVCKLVKKVEDTVLSQS